MLTEICSRKGPYPMIWWLEFLIMDSQNHVISSICLVSTVVLISTQIFWTTDLNCLKSLEVYNFQLHLSVPKMYLYQKNFRDFRIISFT